MNNLKESMMPIFHLPKLNFAILATTILLAGCGGGGGGGGSMDPQIAPREVLTPVIEVKAVGNGVVSIGVGPNTTGTNKATCTSGTQTVSGTGTDNDSVAVSGLVNGQQYDCSVVVVSRDLNQYKDSAASNSVQITPIAIAGSEALQTRTGQFIDSPVAGLGYRTATLSGLTDAEGKFKYVLGEQVAFSINGQPLGSAFAQAMVQISDVTANGFTTPIAAASLQIAQLLQSVDTKVSKEVITIDSAAVKALSIPKFDFGVASSEFVETFTRSLPSQFRLVSDTAAQLHVDQYLATVSTRYDDACGTPRRVYTIGSVTDESKVAIDTASSRFNCSSRGQIVAFTYLIQPWLSSKLATINSQSTVFDDTAQNEQVLLDASSNKNWLQISVKTIGYAAEALDAAVKINDSKTTTIANVTNILATAGLKIVDKYVQTNSASKEDKDLAQRRIKLAQRVISLAATIVECKQANDKIDNAKACAKVLTSAMRVLEQEFKFVVDDDPEGLLAVQAMGSTLTLVLSLENANANPIKMQAAVAEYTAEMLRVAGTYMINVRLPADSTWGAVIESMLAESSSATKAYFDCKAVAFGDLGSLRNCWDGTIPRLTDNLAKAVFRGGLSWSLWANEKELASVYLTDFILREYLSVGADMQVLYAKRAITADTASAYCLFRLNCPSSDLALEKAKLRQLLAQLKGRGQWRDDVPLDETWALFVSTIQSLRTLGEIYGKGDELALAADVLSPTLNVNVSVQARSAVIKEVRCTADGALPASFTVLSGTAKIQSLTYSATGAYQINCTGSKSGKAVVSRSVAVALMNCATGQAIQFGKCVTPTVLSISPIAMSVGDQTEFIVVGKYLPKAAVMAIEGGTCGTATNITSSGFKVLCSHSGPGGNKRVTLTLGSGTGAIVDTGQSLVVACTLGQVLINGECVASTSSTIPLSFAVWKLWITDFPPFYAPPSANVFEETGEGLKFYESVARGGAEIFTKSDYSLAGKTLYAKVKFNGGGTFGDAGIGISFSCTVEPCNAEHLVKLSTGNSYNGSTVIRDNVWYFVRSTISTVGYISVTATGNYDDQGGATVQTYQGYFAAYSNSGKPTIYFGDTYAPTVTTVLGELIIK